MNKKGQVNWFEIIGLIALLSVIGLAGFAILRPILHPGDQQKAQVINNYNYEFPHMGFGCARVITDKDVTKTDNTVNK